MGEEGLGLFMRIQIYANWVSVSRLALQKEKRERQHQVILYGKKILLTHSICQRELRGDLKITLRLKSSVIGSIGPSLILKWKRGCLEKTIIISLFENTICI